MTISNLMKMAGNSPRRYKKQWENEKLLVTSVFERLERTEDMKKPGLVWETLPRALLLHFWFLLAVW